MSMANPLSPRVFRVTAKDFDLARAAIADSHQRGRADAEVWRSRLNFIRGRDSRSREAA